MNKEVLAYLAGIVDGEGNIGLFKRPPKPHCGEKTATFTDYVKVANTDYRLLAWIRDQVGAGTIYCESRKRKGHRQVYTWHISSQQCVEFLAAVYPYLVIKKEQADLIFLFRSTYDKSRFCKAGVPPDIFAIREQCRARLVELHRFVANGPPIKAGPQTTDARRLSQFGRPL